MSVTRSYLLSAQKIIRAYDGSIPFAAWVKNYFRENKKFGSRDRKNILQLCYSFYRLGKAFSFLSEEDRMLAGLFLTIQSSHPLLAELKPEWNDSVSLNFIDKILTAQPSCTICRISGFHQLLQHRDSRTSLSLTG